ncbi:MULTISPECIES: SymE family type I addiction module toxin [Pectobacterium]|uniref:SymE family type I addiction module toxin n=1 Tax=Pectobacterium TaxID=122277 RepID=UPI001873D010|nr:type I addiction module toxin, SymE family [Pectobacterium quasiaquaticum]
MAERHSTSTKRISRTDRQVIVGYRPQQGDTSTPKIILCGKWLRDAGFETGQNVTVKIADGCLTLLPVIESDV